MQPLEIQTGIKEECGVFGIYAPEGGSVSTDIYYGLSALQHRGQESCGIAVSDTAGPKGLVLCHKGLGLVNEVFAEETLKTLTGNIGIGHVRYATTGAGTLENTQPLITETLSMQRSFAESWKRQEPYSRRQLTLRSLPFTLQRNGSALPPWRKPSNGLPRKSEGPTVWSSQVPES